MTTVDLLQRYPSHKESDHHDKVLHEAKALEGNKPDLTSPNQNPSQCFDAKPELLHVMLDRVVKDISNSQLEPASEWRVPLWRSPHQPRSRSPAYSEISDSFESPGRIEHCISDLLSTPMSPTSLQFKGPDGWPLGIEVAMNDFHRGRLSTPILQEKELPNRLIVRKQQQQTPRLGDSGNREGRETVSCNSVPFGQQCDSQRQQEKRVRRSFAFQEQQGSVPFQPCGEWQDHKDSVSLEPEPSQQQSSTRPQQQSGCRYGQESADVHLLELQQRQQEQSDGESCLDVFCIPTLSARKYGEERNSLRNASTDHLHPALANGNKPIRRNLENAGLGLSIYQAYSEEHDASHTRTGGTYLLHRNSRQTAFNQTLPSHNKEKHGNAHQAELQISALIDALDGDTSSSKALGAVDDTGVGSIHRKTSCHNTFGDNRNDTFQAIGSLASEDNKADTDSDLVSWKTSGLLDDIWEESDDLRTSSLTLNQGQPQHFLLRFAEHFDHQKSSEASKRRHSMPAVQGSLTEPFIQSSSPLRVPPTSNLTINPSSKLQFELIKPSRHRLNHSKSSQSILSAATMAGFKELTRKEGRLSPAALTKLRKTAESQQHFRTGPDSPAEQSQAEVHPLLRSKSFSRPSLRPRKISDNSALEYDFEDLDSEGHEVQEGDSVSHQITMKPCPLFQSETRDVERFVDHTFMKKYTLSQRGKIEDAVQCKEEDTDGKEAEYAGTGTPQRSTLRSSNDTTLVPSLEDVTPSSSFIAATSPPIMNSLSAPVVEPLDVVPSSIFQPLISPATTDCYPNSAAILPAAYNSWASTPHEHGHSCSTPSSGATLLTSTVMTSNTTLCNNSPTSCGMTMTPVSSFGQFTGELPASRGTTMTPSSSFGHFPGGSPVLRKTPLTPSSSLDDFTGNKVYRRSVSFSSLFARNHKARYPDVPTAAMTDSIHSSKESAELDQAREVTNDPFTSTHVSSTPFSLNIKAPGKEDLAEMPIRGVDKLNTPTKCKTRRVSLHRRSPSTSGRPNTKEGLECAFSCFSPPLSRPQERSQSTFTPIDTAVKQDGGDSRHRRSLSIATNTVVDQKWEVAPPPTPLDLRDQYSMRYRPGPLDANDHYAWRKDALQGMKQGLRKVFGR